MASELPPEVSLVNAYLDAKMAEEETLAVCERADQAHLWERARVDRAMKDVTPYVARLFPPNILVWDVPGARATTEARYFGAEWNTRVREWVGSYHLPDDTTVVWRGTPDEAHARVTVEQAEVLKREALLPRLARAQGDLAVFLNSIEEASQEVWNVMWDCRAHKVEVPPIALRAGQLIRAESSPGWAWWVVGAACADFVIVVRDAEVRQVRLDTMPDRVREPNLYRHIRLHFMFHGHTFEYRSLGEEGL